MFERAIAEGALGQGNSFHELPDQITQPTLHALQVVGFQHFLKALAALKTLKYCGHEYQLRIIIPMADIAVYANADDAVPLTRSAMNPVHAVKDLK